MSYSCRKSDTVLHHKVSFDKVGIIHQTICLTLHCCEKTCFSVFNWNYPFLYPLQCSCLESPRGGGAWWAAVSGVLQSQTRLKQLSSSSSSGEEKIFFIRWIWLCFNIDLEKKMATHSYSCLENPIDRGAWQATVHGVAENRAWLKWLSTHAHSTLTSCDIKTF